MSVLLWKNYFEYLAKIFRAQAKFAYDQGCSAAGTCGNGVPRLFC